MMFYIQEKEWIQKAADELAILQRKLWGESEIKSLEEMKKAGGKILLTALCLSLRCLFYEKETHIFCLHDKIIKFKPV